MIWPWTKLGGMPTTWTGFDGRVLTIKPQPRVVREGPSKTDCNHIAWWVWLQIPLVIPFWMVIGSWLAWVNWRTRGVAADVRVRV